MLLKVLSGLVMASLVSADTVVNVFYPLFNDTETGLSDADDLEVPHYASIIGNDANGTTYAINWDLGPAKTSFLGSSYRPTVTVVDNPPYATLAVEVDGIAAGYECSVAGTTSASCSIAFVASVSQTQGPFNAAAISETTLKEGEFTTLPVTVTAGSITSVAASTTATTSTTKTATAGSASATSTGGVPQVTGGFGMLFGGAAAAIMAAVM
ncbi:hypothetical protein BDV25DRAFT_135724 [Aspergillus avenaceus]|uniref:GPI anchored protein n=1 Tax=Aspergillus avenaceus TaxID=36643 RepID=A0A5N6U7J8_ASPAV|nr:hypothetical protein BDV25DRAFT_135724 [Aspergillus avenaceus]